MANPQEMKETFKSPFKFLDAYQKEDRDIFFGRDAETDELYDRIFETNLVLLYGASGTGKTSLIMCGLGNRFESSDWMPLFVRREHNIMDSIQATLTHYAVKEMAEGTSIVKQLRSLYLDYFKPIYLVFDQFEELFILGSEEEQQAFFELVRELLSASIQCKILISMREEYIAYLSDFERIIPEIFDNRQRIEKMSSLMIREVIAATANAFDIEVVEPEATIDAIIQNLRDKRAGIDLANLQVYLDRLYRDDVARKPDGRDHIVFDPDLVAQTGELKDVLSAFLDEQIEVIEAELATQKVPRKGVPMDVLFALVTDNGTKQTLEIATIKKQLQQRKHIDPAYVDHCIMRFKQMRIIRELSDTPQ